jgi:hypothetical protein
MRDQPRAPELIDAVSEFLQRDVMPRLTGRVAFHTRVAVNVLAIIRREITEGPQAEGRELARLKDLLHAEGDVETLNGKLCDEIAAGDIAWDDPKLLEHLWATTIDTLAIDQPNYATYRRQSGAAPAK